MKTRKIQTAQPNLGMLLLLEEITPEWNKEWNKLQDRDKNLGLPRDKAEPFPAEKDLSGNAAGNPLPKKNKRLTKTRGHKP